MVPRIDIAAVLARVQVPSPHGPTSASAGATPLALLRNLREHGHRWRLDGAHLYVDVTTSALSPALCETLRQHQDALLTLLEWYEERAGILEYEAGLSRAEAEREAWTHMEDQDIERQTKDDESFSASAEPAMSGGSLSSRQVARG